jgi:hypothetical protein
MKDFKKVYAHFNILERNRDNELTKVTYSSLDKYNGSPYLQRTVRKIQVSYQLHTKSPTEDKSLLSKLLKRDISMSSKRLSKSRSRRAYCLS